MTSSNTVTTNFNFTFAEEFEQAYYDCGMFRLFASYEDFLALGTEKQHEAVKASVSR